VFKPTTSGATLDVNTTLNRKDFNLGTSSDWDETAIPVAVAVRGHLTLKLGHAAAIEAPGPDDPCTEPRGRVGSVSLNHPTVGRIHPQETFFGRHPGLEPEDGLAMCYNNTVMLKLTGIP